MIFHLLLLRLRLRLLRRLLLLLLLLLLLVLFGAMLNCAMFQVSSQIVMDAPGNVALDYHQ